jgi:hypothetical protein
MWLSYYAVSTPAGELRHDLAVSTHAGTLPSARMAGFSEPAERGTTWLLPILLLVAPFVLVAGGRLLVRRRSS